MKRVTEEGVTQDKAERQIWENFSSTLPKQSHIQEQKIKKLKQYYFGIYLAYVFLGQFIS